MPDTRRYKANGKLYNIPEDKIQEFLDKFPDAVEVNGFSVGEKKYNIPTSKVVGFLESYPDAEPLDTGGEVAVKEKKKAKDYTKDAIDFISKMPGFALDWGERFASGALRMPKQVGQGAEHWVRNRNVLFNAIQKYEYEKIGIPKETAEKITNTLKEVLPIPGPVSLPFVVTKEIYNAVKDTGEFQSIEKLSQKLYEKGDRYKGKDVTELWKDGDKMEAIGAWVLFGAESMPQSIVAMAGGPAGAAGLGLMAAGEKYDELVGREDMSEAIRMINSNLTGVLEAGTEYMGSVQIGRIFKRVLSKGGKKQLQNFAEKISYNWLSNLWKKM
ncbi:unnamed protein product, partial [marine sediment metagenome]